MRYRQRKYHNSPITNQSVVLPLGLLFAYGVLRLSSSLFNELRDAVFARVRYHAMHLIALGVLTIFHPPSGDCQSKRHIKHDS
jgi:hypothetical protein